MSLIMSEVFEDFLDSFNDDLVLFLICISVFCLCLCLVFIYLCIRFCAKSSERRSSLFRNASEIPSSTESRQQDEGIFVPLHGTINQQQTLGYTDVYRGGGGQDQRPTAPVETNLPYPPYPFYDRMPVPQVPSNSSKDQPNEAEDNPPSYNDVITSPNYYQKK